MPLSVRLPDFDHWKSQVKCQAGCPVSTDAGRYVQLIAEGRHEEAYLVARAPNPFASICGRVCAAPCEDACRRGAIDAPVAIRALKRFVTEKYGVESTRPDTQDRLAASPIEEGNRYAGHMPLTVHRAGPPEQAGPRGRVAVVGAGPAGMAAAHDLAVMGYGVTVFEAAPEPGGMVRFGIPEYRLPRSVIRAEIEKITGLGVELRLNTALTPEYRPRRPPTRWLRRRLSVGRRVDRPRPAGARRRAGRRRQGDRLPAERQPRVPRAARPARGRHRRRLRRLRRGAHRAPRHVDRRGARARGTGGRIGCPGEGGVRLRAIGCQSGRARRDGGVPRELRGDARAPHHPGARRVRGGEARRRPVPHTPRPASLHRPGTTLRRRTARRHLGVRCGRPLRADLRGPRRRDDRDRRLHSGDRPAGGPVVSDARGRRGPDAGRDDPDRRVNPGHVGAGRVRGRRCRLRPAQSHRGRRQRQAGGAVDPWVPEPRHRVDRGAPRHREDSDVPLPDGRRLRALRPEGGADARRRSPHRDYRGRNGLRRRRRDRAGRPLPGLPRADDLRSRALRAVQPLRRHLPRALPGHRPVRQPRSRGRDARRAGGARAGVEPAPLGHGERRRAVHPVRPVRGPLSDRRDDDGEIHDYGTPRGSRALPTDASTPTQVGTL